MLLTQFGLYRLLQEPQIFSKNITSVYTSAACSNFKAHGKVPPWFMSPKSETSNFELLVLSKGISYIRKYGTDKKVGAIDSKIVQLQESGTVLQPRRISSSVPLHSLSRIGKQYTKMLGEYDTLSPASSNVWGKGYQRLPAWLSEVPTSWSNLQTVVKGRGFSQLYLFKCIPNLKQWLQTDLWGIRRTSIQRQYYFASFSRATQVL